MKVKVLFFFMLVCAVFAGCSSDDDNADARPQSPIIGHWVVTDWHFDNRSNPWWVSIEDMRIGNPVYEFNINRNGTFFCTAFPYQPETSGYYRIDDNTIKCYTDEQMLKPAFRCVFQEIRNDSAEVRFCLTGSNEWKEVRMRRR